jgi:hypothetical protein
MPFELQIGMIAGAGALALWMGFALVRQRQLWGWPFLAGWVATLVIVPVLLLGTLAA